MLLGLNSPPACVVQVCSLPIVLITQVLQECNAMGTLIWNAAFPLEVSLVVFPSVRSVCVKLVCPLC